MARAGSKAVRRVVADLEARGCEVTFGGNNHIQVRQHGRLVTTMAASPSDGGWVRLLQQYLRRAGVLRPGERLPGC